MRPAHLCRRTSPSVHRVPSFGALPGGGTAKPGCDPFQAASLWTGQIFRRISSDGTIGCAPAVLTASVRLFACCKSGCGSVSWRPFAAILVDHQRSPLIFCLFRILTMRV